MSNESNNRVEALVLRFYNFESENEDNENGEDLSSLSDVFVEDDELENEHSLNGSPSADTTQLLSIHDVTYDRDLKWINVPNGDRPKPVIQQANRFVKQVQSITSGNRSELDALDKHYQSMDNIKRDHDKKFLVEFDTDKPTGRRESRGSRGGRGSSRRRGGGNLDGSAPDRRDRGDVDSVEDESGQHNEQSYASTRLRSTGRGDRKGGRGAGLARHPREEAPEHQDTRKRNAGAPKVEGKGSRSSRGGRGCRNKHVEEPVDSIWDQPGTQTKNFVPDESGGTDLYASHGAQQHFEESFEPPTFRPPRQSGGYSPPPPPAHEYSRQPHLVNGRPQPRVPYQHPHSKYGAERNFNLQPVAQAAAAYSTPSAYEYGNYGAYDDGGYGADLYGAPAAAAIYGDYSSRRGYGNRAFTRDHSAAHNDSNEGTTYYPHPNSAAGESAPRPARQAPKIVPKTSEATYNGQEARLNPKAAEFVPTWAT